MNRRKNLVVFALLMCLGLALSHCNKKPKLDKEEQEKNLKAAQMELLIQEWNKQLPYRNIKN